jgi:hypothetical protein
MTIRKKRKKVNGEQKSVSYILNIPEPRVEVYNLRTYIYEIDFEEEFNNVKMWLQYKPKTPSQMEDVLYEAGNISNKSQLLIESIKLEEKKYELECRERLEILRSGALLKLEEEKKEKSLKKQITNQMIEDRVLADHSKLYIGIHQKQNELKSIRSLVENLYEQVKNKEVNVRKILESQSYHRLRPGWADKNK